MKLKFLGATETVTGSKHLVITEKGRQVLLDCGLYQGMGKATDEMNRKLGINPSHIEAVLLSHGHIDHCGNLPNLVKQGFTGKIYCTPATLDVCRILLMDSAHIHQSDVKFINKRRKQKGQPEIEPLYTIKDAEQCLEQFKGITYDTDFRLNDELSFYFSTNGHVIGSAAINLTARENGKFTRLTFTGDIGRYNDPLLKPPGVFNQADYIICESTYGDRLHETVADAEQHILDTIRRTCIGQKGKLLMPAFSLGRTQEILFILDKLANKGLMKGIEVYVDSPLSTKSTNVVRSHPEGFNDELKAYLKKDPEPFGFPGLTYIEDKRDSQKLNDKDLPCVIIAASGMADAGRIKHHLRYNIQDSRNTVMLTGYCAEHTLGARLLAGDKQVHIFGDVFDVKAGIESISSLSAHGDYNEMTRFLSCQNKSSVKKIFLVHGEHNAKMAFKAHLENEGYADVHIPSKGEVHDLS